MRRLFTVLALALAACVSTEPIDPTTAPVVGSYAFTGRTLPPGTPSGFSPGGTARNVISDDYTLTAGGGWTRAYRGTAQPVGGAVAPEEFTRAGTYVRAGSQLTFSVVGTSLQYTGTFTGTGMTIPEGGYIMAYTLR